MFSWLKQKKDSYVEQLESYYYTQLELEYAYRNSGNQNNTIISGKDLVSLVFEKYNQYDSNAVAVYAYNLKIG